MRACDHAFRGASTALLHGYGVCHHSMAHGGTRVGSTTPCDTGGGATALAPHFFKRSIHMVFFSLHGPRLGIFPVKSYRSTEICSTLKKDWKNSVFEKCACCMLLYIFCKHKSSHYTSKFIFLAFHFSSLLYLNFPRQYLR